MNFETQKEKKWKTFFEGTFPRTLIIHHVYVIRLNLAYIPIKINLPLLTKLVVLLRINRPLASVHHSLQIY